MILSIVAVAALLALNVLQLVLGHKERHSLLDRIQARNFTEFKLMERKEKPKKGADDEKEPPEFV